MLLSSKRFSEVKVELEVDEGVNRRGDRVRAYFHNLIATALTKIFPKSSPTSILKRAQFPNPFFHAFLPRTDLPNCSNSHGQQRRVREQHREIESIQTLLALNSV